MKLDDLFEFSPADDPDLVDDEYILKANTNYRVQVTYESGDAFYTPTKIDGEGDDFGVIFYDTVMDKNCALMDAHLLSQKDAA
jgi:hypothetical protein